MSEGGFDFDAEYGAHYDDIVRKVVPGYEHIFSMVLALFRSRVFAAGRILVVGAGSGSELIALAGNEPQWRLTGVEPSAQMVRIARTKANAAGLGGRVEVHQGVLEDLPVGERYDAATLICVMHFLPDDGAKAAMLHAIAERLRPGAPLVLVDAHGEPGTAQFDARFLGWMRFIEAMGMSEAGRATYRAQVDASVHWTTERRILDLLADAGFVDVLPFYMALVFGGWLARRA